MGSGEQDRPEFVHVVKSGESVWTISETLAREALGAEASNRIINEEKNRIIQRNGLNRNGRKESLIYPGEGLIIPPLDHSRPNVKPQAIADEVQQPKVVASIKEADGPNVCLPSLKWEQEARKGECVEYPRESGVARMYEKVKPAVVQIEARRPGKQAGTVDISDGSGFFVDRSGLIASSYHVVGDFKEIKVMSSDGKKYDATIVAEDKENDMVILEVASKSKGKEKESQKFPALEIEETSSTLKMRQPILVFGHPNGWNETYLSEGQINGATTIGKIQAGPLNPPEENPNRKVYAVMSHGEGGNSGGPAVSESGKVMGLVDSANEKTSAKGDHVFVTPVEPLNALVARARGLRNIH